MYLLLYSFFRNNMDNLNRLENVVRNSRHVQINEDMAIAFAKDFARMKIDHWMECSPLAHTHLDYPQKAAFLFVFNAISFCYWGNPKWAIESEGQTYNRGTWNLIAAIQRAMKEDIHFLDSSYLANLSAEELGHILRGNVEIPLLNERAAILREVGSTVTRKYGEDFLQAISTARSNSAEDLVNRLVEEFPSFEDSSDYGGGRINFHKRAQLLVSDLNYSLKLELRDTDKLTACADYILPLVLRYSNILEYDSVLASKIDCQVEIPKDSEEEVEIRAGTIIAVEKIKSALLPLSLTSMQLNDYLWLAGDNVPQTQQYHLTRTTMY